MSHISVDVIIVNYNSTEYTLRCIESVLKNVKIKQLRFIVVDNKSNDLPEKITETFPEVYLIKNPKNLGFGKAINIALKYTTSEYILLLNPDSEVKDRTFACIFDYLEMHTDISVAGPMVLDSDGSLQGSARRFPTAWTSIFGRKSPLTKLFPNNPITKKEFLCFNCDKDNAIDVDWVSGACMIVRRKTIKQIGGFDERFFLYWEDTDLCKRIKESGGRVVYYPKTCIFHSVGKSSEKKAIGAILHFHISCFKLFGKHARMPWKLLIPIAFAGLTARCLFVFLLYAGNSALLAIKCKKSSSKKEEYNAKNKMIRTLRIVSRLNIGGPSIHVTLLSNKMDPQRFETILITGTRSPSEGDMSYLLEDYHGRVKKIDELQREINLKNDLIAFLKIFFIIAKERPDIVHTHMSKAGTIGRLAACCWKLFGNNNLRIVHTFHGHVLEGYFSSIKSDLFRLIEIGMAKISDAVIAISKSQRWELTNKYQIATSNKVHVVNLGFDLSPFLQTQRYKGILRKNLGIGNDTLLVGIVGRLVPIKNHQMFLDGAKIFLNRNSNIDAKFIIVGDGELREQLENYTEKIGIEDKVIFLGWEKELRYIYADLDVLALTSINEGTPVSIIEAMASSVPVITTGVGGVSDLLGNFKKIDGEQKYYKECERGILCPKNNHIAFAEGLEYIVQKKLSKESNIISNARNHVLQNYSESRLIEKMEALYERLICNN